MGIELKNAAHFFETARERYQIKLRRDAGQSFPWTQDKIFQTWRFCNVHREHDKTTTWLREQVRIPLRNADNLKIVFATVAFRWFNRISTGERIRDLLIGEWDAEEARRRLVGVSPVVTGAYMIKSPDGMSKLDGVLWCIENARKNYLPRFVPSWGSSLHDAWDDLRHVEFLAGFLSYEVITDLRWTKVLSGAHDIMTWTNAGPGCARGLGWVVDGNPYQFNRHSPAHQETMLGIMQELLRMSQSEEFWPRGWASWDMREPEMWACEYDKYMRAKRGDSMKRRFQP